MERPNLYYALKNVEHLPNAQRECFVHYRGNYFLERAVKREQSLEEAVEELSKPFQKKGQYLPHVKNQEHNERAKQLENLLPHRLYTRGIYFPDNLVTGLSYCALFTVGISITPKVSDAVSWPLGLAFAVTCIGGAFISAAAGIYYSRCLPATLKAANYIDNVIKEFGIK